MIEKFIMSNFRLIIAVLMIAFGVLVLWDYNDRLNNIIQEPQTQPAGESYQQAQPHKLEQHLDINRQDAHSAEICINNQVFILLVLKQGNVYGPLRDNTLEIITCKEERSQ